MAGKKRTDNKGRILRNGEQQRSQDGRYMYRYTDLSGKKRTIYALTLPELRDREKQIERDLQDGINPDGAQMTLNDTFELYLKTKSNIKQTTRCSYMESWKSGVENSALGNMKICQIKSIHIKAHYSDLTKRGWAKGTVRICHNLIAATLEFAVSADCIRKNPAKGLGREIGGARKKKVALTIEEQRVFLDFVKNSDRFCVYYPMIVFALSTGVRVGELTALRWSNIDLKAGVVHIREQLIYDDLGDGHRFHLQGLKTAAGLRDIPLTQDARKALTNQKEFNLMLGKTARQKTVEGVSDFIFLNLQGKPYPTCAIDRALYDIVKTYNKQEEKKTLDDGQNPLLLPRVSMHLLRHTYCSRMAESGMEPKVLQKIMGHSNISVTMDVYTHLDSSHIIDQVKIAEEKLMKME